MTTDGLTLKAIAKMIDHSLLHPTMTDAIVTEGCEVAKSHGVATACVKPYSTAMAARILEGSGVAVCTVTGFPHGNSTVAIKVEETKLAMREGATEIDTVVNIGKVLGGDWEYVTAELREVNAAATGGGAILKVIFENDYLQDEHIVKLCGICSKLQVAFVKTSTGYGFVRQSNGMYAYQGATDHHLQLMRANCPPSVQVKAAGGVRALDDVLRVRALGVTRIGATATVAILEEARKRGIT